MANCRISTRKGPIFSSTKAIADAASWCCAFFLVSLILICIFRDSSLLQSHVASKGCQLFSQLCDEIYVVGEGETLHTISDKCGDPFIVEKNPHIHDQMMSSQALLSRLHLHNIARIEDYIKRKRLNLYVTLENDGLINDNISNSGCS